MSELHSPSVARVIFGWIGVLFVRLFIPAWIFFGAWSKVMDASPKSLPRTILDAGEAVGFSDHFLLLALLTAIEFLFIAAMLFFPKLARSAAITILSIFLLVLSVEIYNGAESCGCLGKVSLKPSTMFAIDFGLLLGIVFIKPRKSKRRLNRGTLGRIGAGIFIAAAWVFTFTSILGAKNSNSTTDLPASWITPSNFNAWIGESVDEIDLFSFVTQWPHDIHIGQQYVIFYARTCDHCEELLYVHFEFDMRVPTTLVAIPEMKSGFFEEGQFENPCVDCAETELPIGADWLITPPLVIAIDNGIIQCVTESEDPEDPSCLIW